MDAAPTAAGPALTTDPLRTQSNLDALRGHLDSESFAALQAPLTRLLPRTPDPDRAVNNLERLLAKPAARTHFADLLRGRMLETLLQLLGTSQFLSDVLIRYPEFLDQLQAAPRPGPEFADLVGRLRADVDAAGDDAGVLRAFRRFRQRQLLRIGILDVVRSRPLEEITRDISRVAEAAIEVALAVATRKFTERFGVPMSTAGRPARIAVLAFGKLGGEELNYSSDIDLMFIYDAEGQTRGKRGDGLDNAEFFGRVVGELTRLLSTHTDRGAAYRVDLRLRPEGKRGALARSLASTLSYYDARGRTWERQALIKCRPVAGDPDLGAEFMRAIEPFVYRTYFSFSEINEVRAIKRQIERKAHETGGDDRDVKTGRGGIRDIEFTIQFLQLLNGGDLPAVRVRNTLAALHALAEAGCVTAQECQLLDDSYRFLRKTEHRLQLLFDLQTHRLPEAPEELRHLALRMGYNRARPPVAPRGLGGTARRRPAELDDIPADATLDARALIVDPLDAFLRDYQEKTRLNRTILDHLLHFTFGAGADPEGPESDLVLEPDPDPHTVAAVLGRYGFRDPAAAFFNLASLAQENVRFLSSRRCRHFLAGIAPRLLKALADTPDPDLALLNLEKVTAGLGAKAVLWELFSFNPPSLTLTVELCAHSPFLVDILVNNPGMIDELLDSLVLNRPRSIDELRSELAALCKGAEDAEPILHSFHNKELLRIGVGDVLGKTPVRETAAALADLAEVILAQATAEAEVTVQARWGQPNVGSGPRAWQPCRWALVALGKLGGRELSYHSDLDLVVMYEADGPVLPPPGIRLRKEPIDNLQYFIELARLVIKKLSTIGPMGRLYAIDMRLRPSGKSGSLAVSLDEFRRYHSGGGGQVWERLALTKARVVVGDAEFADEVQGVVSAAVYQPAWQPSLSAEIVAMREKLEASRGPRSLKRASGGLTDVEFLVQTLQLRFGHAVPAMQTVNTRIAILAAKAAQLVPAAAADELLAGYDFLRSVEARLRLVTNRATDELPDDPAELSKLARRLGFQSENAFQAAFDRHTQRLRAQFREIVESRS